MSPNPFFPKEEFDLRLHQVRALMDDMGIKGCIVSVPEHIYYLAGINHWGYFASHLLIVPRDGEMVMIARAMEKVTMSIQLTNARFVGYEDLDDPATYVVSELKSLGLSSGRLGIEKGGLYLPLSIAERITTALPHVEWVDISEPLLALRSVLSPLEIEYTRRAAAVSDAMMRAAIDAAGEGVNEREIAAAVHKAMIVAGGEFPAFGPFIRSTQRLGEEHGTWADYVLKRGDALFVELSGSVARYHAPMGRIIFIGEAPSGTIEMEHVCLDAFNQVVKTIRPGITAHEVYEAWQATVDAAGLSHYRRHHCGYRVGCAFPPAWSGGGVPRGLRRNSNMVLRAGNVFHLMSWLMGTGRGDYFVSDTAIVTESGCEVLTSVSQKVHVV